MRKLDDWYKENQGIFRRDGFSGIDYSDGDEVELRLGRVIEDSKDLSVLSHDLRNFCQDWPSTYHLSSQRANILRPFAEQFSGADVLEIGSGLGAITRYLGEAGSTVLALEGSIRRAKITKARTADLERVTVLAERFSDFETHLRFDIVTLVGVLEYASLYSDAHDPFADMLERTRRLLRPGGKLIIAIENQLGLKYFAGAPEDHLGQPMIGIEGRYRKGGVCTFGRKELERRVLSSGFSRTELFLPFPDYKLPTTIVAEAAFECKGFDAAALVWPGVCQDPQLPLPPNFSPELVWPQLGRNGLIPELSNSLLLVAHAGEADTNVSKTLAWHFNTARRPQFCKATTFEVLDNGNLEVRIERLGPIAEDGPGQPRFEIAPKSEYHNGTLLSKKFIALVGQDGWSIDDMVAFFENYRDILRNLILQDKPNAEITANGDFFLPGNYVDALPQNIMELSDTEWRFFDREWVSPAPVSFQYLLFRSFLTLSTALSTVGRPVDPRIATWGNIADPIYIALGLGDFSACIEDLVRREERLQEYVTPCPVSLRNWANQPLLLRRDLRAQISERDVRVAELQSQISDRDGRITQIEQRADTLQEDLINARRRPVKMLRRLLAYKVLKRLSNLSPPLPSNTANRLARSAAKRNPKRRLPEQEARNDVAMPNPIKEMLTQKPVEELSKVVQRFHRSALKRVKSLRAWLSSRERDTALSKKIRSITFDYAPKISIVMPVYNIEPKLLTLAIASVQSQTYGNWELCICDDGSDRADTRKALKLLQEGEPRLKLVLLNKNQGISTATNTALSEADGEFIGFLDNDDELLPHALESCVRVLNEDPTIDVIYSDEEKLNSQGQTEEPFYKPDWSPSFLREVMYVGHFLVSRKELIERAGGLDSRYDGVQDFELMLRLSENTNKIHHIQEILYLWRRIPGSIADRIDAKPNIGELQVAAVRAHLQRIGMRAEAHPHDHLPHRVTLRPLISPEYKRISIIIPTKDAPQLIERCLGSIFSTTTHPNFEVIVVDNGTTDKQALDILKNHRISVVKLDEPFNYSRANNFGAQQASGELLVFLNNDTEVIQQDWLQQMAFFFDDPLVAVVGPLLLYPDDTVQHAGVALGMRGTADHVLRGSNPNEDGYFGSLACSREVSAVTFACAMTRRTDYLATDGLDELFQTHYQDVDYCLKFHETGRRVIFTPHARLVHWESATRGPHYNVIDRALLRDRWGALIDAGDPFSRWEASARGREKSI
jgi:glycosyltransferase involved in cell wall biosynthesis/SAM-dependent methyltransferase